MASTNRLRSWRHRFLLADASGYRLALLALLAGQLVSWTGNRIYQLALPLLVIERYGVDLSLGLVLAVRLVPTILLGPWAGVLTDRLPRRPVIAAANIASSAAVLLMPFTASIDQLYLLSALLGVVDALVRPANFALLPEVFPREQLLRVNTTQEVLDAISNIAGPGLKPSHNMPNTYRS